MDQLKTYIRDQLHAGFSPDEVAAHLKAANWSADMVQQAFQDLQGEMIPSGMKSAPAASANPPQATTIRKGRIRVGWQLFRQSLRIIGSNKRLVRFTIMSAIWNFVISLAFFVLILIIVLTNRTAFESKSASSNIFAYGFGFLTYVVFFFIANLYAAGLTASVLDIFKGQRRTYREYMHEAWSRAPALLTYSVIESTVGLVLRLIVERFRFVGWILARIFGAVWSFGTLFVIPEIVDNPDMQAPQAIKQSFGLFKKTWGQSIVARASAGIGIVLIGIIMFVVYVVLTAVIIIGVAANFGKAGAIASVIAIMILLLTWLVGVMLLGLLSKLMNSIINVALYYYATTGQVPPAFDADLLNSVFVARKRRGLFGLGRQKD